MKKLLLIYCFLHVLSVFNIMTVEAGTADERRGFEVNDEFYTSSWADQIVKTHYVSNQKLFETVD